MRRAAIISIIALLSMLLNGYFYGISDQVIYIPVVYKIADPSLFQNDIFFEQQSGEYTFFFHILAYLSRIFDMEWVFFVLYFIATYIMFYAIHRISFSLFQSERAAYIAIILCFIPKPISGSTAGSTRFLVPRSFAMPIALIALWLLIERKYIWAAVTAAIAFQIHPLTAIAPIMSIMGYIVFNFRKIGKAKTAKILAAFAIAVSPIFLKIFLSQQTNMNDLSFFSKAPEDWMQVLRIRNEYAFPSLWGVGYWICAIFYPLLFALGFAFAKDKPRYETIWIAGAGLLSFSLCFFLGDLFPIPLVVQFQMARGLFLVGYMALIYAANLIDRSFRELPLASRMVTVAIAVSLATDNVKILMAAVAASTLLILSRRFRYFRFLGFIPFIAVLFIDRVKFPSTAFLIIALSLILTGLIEVTRRLSRVFDIWRYAPIPILVIAILAMKAPVLNDILFQGKMDYRINFPGRVPQTDWIRVQKWAKDNTDKDALFIVPKGYDGFRLYSRRSIAGDWKDGASGLFSRQYALKWYKRMKSLEKYGKLKEDDFVRLAENYQATHVITKGNKLDFENLYAAGGFYVYEIPRPAK